MRQQYHFRRVAGDVFVCDVLKLIRLAEPIKMQEISLNDIRELDQEYWYELGGAKPTCRNIAEHAQLINEADLQTPILLCREMKVMDGMHRICRALIEGKASISAKVFEKDVAPDFINIDISELKY